MASLRSIAQYVLEEARDGIAWIALWKKGRSWDAETFYTDYNSDNMDSFDPDTLERFRKIVTVDSRAILVNGYYCNLGDTTCMTRDSLANALRWQYGLENPFLLVNELEYQANAPSEGAEETADAKVTEEETETTQEEFEPTPTDTFNYRLLDRCKADCEYYLGYGNQNNKDLWGKNPTDHIAKMRELYAALPIKPEWLTAEQIDDYAKRIGV